METIEFIRQFPVRRLEKGEIIMSEGDVSETLLAIQQGFVKVSSLDENGNERLLWIASRYDIVPTERLFSQSGQLDFFYTALSDTTVYEVNKADFLAHAKDDLPLMSEIATSMSGHYDDLLTRINTVEQVNVRDKLIATLRYLAKRFSAEMTVDLYRLGLTLTHQDLAEMIGSTRETTSVELHKLRESGCIDYDRTKFIIHLDACKLSSVS